MFLPNFNILNVVVVEIISCNSGRYKILLYCLSVQADFNSGLRECWTVQQALQIQDSAGTCFYDSVTFIQTQNILKEDKHFVATIYLLYRSVNRDGETSFKCREPRNISQHQTWITALCFPFANVPIYR